MTISNLKQIVANAFNGRLSKDKVIIESMTISPRTGYIHYNVHVPKTLLVYRDELSSLFVQFVSIVEVSSVTMIRLNITMTFEDHGKFIKLLGN